MDVEKCPTGKNLAETNNFGIVALGGKK